MNIFIESVSWDGSARLLCILSRPSAEPRWVRPVPVTYVWAGSGWSIGRQHALFLIRRGEVDNLADAAFSDKLAQVDATLDRRVSQRERGARAFDKAAFPARRNDQGALSASSRI